MPPANAYVSFSPGSMADEREDKTGTTLRVTGEGRTFRVTETGVELSRERSPFAPARTRRVAFGDVIGVEVEPARRRSLFRLGLVVVAVAIAHSSPWPCSSTGSGRRCSRS